MKVSSVSNKYITPKTTGYAAVIGLGLTAVSGFAKNNSIRKAHKPFAIAAAVLSAIHVGLIEYYHFKYKQNK